MEEVKITIELSNAQAMALAQFIKRSSWDTFRDCAVDTDEAGIMINASNKIKKALAEEGFSPR